MKHVPKKVPNPKGAMYRGDGKKNTPPNMAQRPGQTIDRKAAMKSKAFGTKHLGY